MDECSRRLHQLDNNPVGIQCQMKFYLTRKRALVHTQLIAYSPVTIELKQKAQNARHRLFVLSFLCFFPPNTYMQQNAQNAQHRLCTRLANHLWRVQARLPASPDLGTFPDLGQAAACAIYIHAYIHPYIHIYIHKHTHTYIRTYTTHTYVYAYIHTYIHTYVRTS